MSNSTHTIRLPAHATRAIGALVMECKAGCRNRVRKRMRKEAARESAQSGGATPLGQDTLASTK